MSRITKWKFEKTKVKVVFRLQFHATHIPQTGWDKLFISFIPADSGKATAKTTKANVRNGTCKWADPIYETTRLLQDLKTKRYDEKLYKLVVAMGSSRASALGEATINLADYADALKPFAVALPLHGCDFGTFLHVTVQLLTSKTGFREFEQQRELREKGLQNDHSSPDGSSGGKVLSSEEISNDQMDKVSARVRFKEKSKDLTSLEDEMGQNEDYADSAVGFDGSSNTSGSLYAEKHDSLGTNEVESFKSTVSGDLAGLSLGRIQLEKGDHSDHRSSGQGASDWIRGWSSDFSADNDFVALYEENSRLRGSLEVAESSILELKLEVNSLQSHAEEIGFEARKFAKQLATEIASGEELAQEVSLLKSECSNLKNDLERLKVWKVHPNDSGEALEATQNHMFQDLWHRWLKGLLFVEEKIRELQSKACFGFHERDLRFLHVDFEALLSALENLKQGFGQTVYGLNSTHPQEASVKEIGEISLHKNGQFVTGNVFDVDSYQTELGMLQCLGIPEPADATNAMKGKIFELLRELDDSKSERESLAKKMGEMECYYEALVQELEENQRQMLVEMQNLKNEHSTCLYTVSTTKAEMEILHKDLNGQIMRLSEDKHHLDSLNKDLERRAVTAEAALKRARLNYSIAVNHLQKDLELLSSQVSSMFETNENLIRQVVDSSQFNSQKYDSGEPHEVEALQRDSDFGGVKKQQLGGDIVSDDLKRSLYLQEGLYLKVEGEVNEMHFVNLYLDVFSKTLQETLLEASGDVKLMQEKLNELVWKLELSTESKEVLVQKLQSVMNDVDSLNEYKATSIAKDNEMALQNQILEANLQNVTHENHLLMQKVREWESLAIQYQSYESKYEACAAERTDLACLLESKSVENENLQNEIFSLQEELKAVKTEFDQLASVKENMQNYVNVMETKLHSMLSSCEKSIVGLPPFPESGNQDSVSSDSTSLILRLQEFHENACAKILQLMDDNKALMHERDVARMSTDAAESHIMSTKHQFECDIRNMVGKLDVSNVLVQKLQLGVETITNRFKASAEVDERHAQMQTELLSVLNHLEDELQELISKYGDLADEIMTLDSVADELGRSKLTAVELAKKNQDLVSSLQDKNEESSRLASELETLKEKVKFLHDENQALLSSKEKGEESSLLASELSSLKESLQSMHTENQALMSFSQEKAEEAAKLLLEVSSLKESLRFLQDENQALIESSRDKVEKCAKLTLELNSSRESLQSLSDENEALVMSSREKMEESVKLLSQLSSINERMQSLHDEKQALMLLSRDKTEEVASLVSEINNLKENLQSLIYEKQDLKVSLLGETEKSVHLVSEVNSMRESFQSLQDELQDERSSRARLESTIEDLNSQLNEKQGKLLQLDQCEYELVHLKQMVSELESEKSRANDLTLHYEECLKNAQESSSVSTLETLLSEMNELLVATDIRFIFTESQYRSRFEELVQQFYSFNRKNAELQKKHMDVEANLNICLGREARLIEENAKLLMSVGSLRSELEAFVAENSLLLEKNRAIRVELDEYKGRSQSSYCEDEGEHSSKVEELKHKLISSEGKIDNLMLAKEELEIKVLVFEAKLDEQKTLAISLEGHIDELSMLRRQCNELMQKLSEQVLKTEEFKNLSVRLKELKDKADAECNQALAKKEPDGPPAAMQDSLRIAFIKEQYEGRLQELKQQFSISKKHSEEMLWKLQDALDEIEKRKKSEVSHLKKNEELGMKILELEEELQSALAEKREKMSAYDLMKAEMECSLISLECCKEEKQKLEVSLKECKEENSRITAEITLLKERAGNLKSVTAMLDEGNDVFVKVDGMSSDDTDSINYRENTRDKNVDIVPWNGSVGDTNLKSLRRETLNSHEEAEQASSAPDDEIGHSSPLKNVQAEQDVLVSSGVSALEKSLNSEAKQLVLINDRFKAESLRSSMDHLSNELERMKNENSLILMNDADFQQKFPGLQSELLQLQKANEELGSMFPLFNEFSRSGNSLERVLALEIELAEALQTKKKSSIHFQSSFLKQHSDDEAIFKSFKDINDLIKDMLELKGRYASVETELKEMHDRYSQLSLQFAEVEGERQKLMMTLKNVRASKKALNLSRSSSATLGDHSL